MNQLVNTLDNIARWEQRDVLSYSVNLVVSKSEELIITAIMTNLFNKINFSWDSNSLSLVAEAKLQQLLRRSGYDLLCYNLNTLPYSINELSQYVTDYSLQLQIGANLSIIKNRTNILFTSIVRTVLFKLFNYLSSTAGTQSTILILLLLVLINNTEYFLYALITGFVISNCVTLIFHEYWAHRQICPKNRIIGFIFDYICHLFVHDRITWVYSHINHHRHWKTSQDKDWKEMLRMRWIYYFVFSSPVHNSGYSAEIENKRSSLTSELLPESQFLQNYIKEITLVTHLIFLLTFGLSIYVYFLLFQIWIFHKYIICFDELVTHYNNKTQEEEVDRPLLFLICCGTAYHKSHHMLSDSLILGPGKLKYLNIQYYFIKLFYNITAKVPSKY